MRGETMEERLLSLSSQISIKAALARARGAGDLVNLLFAAAPVRVRVRARPPSIHSGLGSLARSLSPCFPPFCPLSVRGSRETKRPSFLASVNSSPTITERAGIEDSIHSVCLVGVHSFPSDSDRFKAFTSSHSPGPRPLPFPPHPPRPVTALS